MVVQFQAQRSGKLQPKQKAAQQLTRVRISRTGCEMVSIARNSSRWKLIPHTWFFLPKN